MLFCNLGRHMKTLNHFMKGPIEKIEKILLIPPSGYKTEDFHELRIEIKKIRFVTELISLADKDFKKQDAFQSFNRIYDLAGDFRNARLQSESLKKFSRRKLFADYNKKLSESMMKARADFFSELQQYDKEGMTLNFNSIRKAAKKISKSDIKKYLKKQYGKVKDELKSSQVILQLHDVRKLLKNISYAEKLMQLTSGRNQKNMQKLSDLIGDWHDITITIEHLRKSLTHNTDKKQTIFLEEIIADLYARATLLMQKITPKLHQVKKSI